MPETLHLHPETGNYDSRLLPPASDEKKREAQEKYARGEKLTLAESMALGRDETQRELGEIELSSDMAYRAVGKAGLDAYVLAGKVTGQGDSDEYEPGGNRGVDWYLGGVAPKYGEIVLEAPANPEYFMLADDFGTRLSKDSLVRHIKSSGHRKPVPIDQVKVIVKDKDGRYVRTTPEDAPIGHDDS